MTVYHGRDGGRQSGCGITVCIDCIYGSAAVVAEHLGVQAVVGMLGIHLNTGSQETVTVGVEVESPFINTVGRRTHIIVCGVVGYPKAGAESCKQLVLSGCHVLDSVVFLNY